MSSYKISEPSALKFLKANGAVVDENGNVISDASDYWKKVYDQAEPKVAKYLHADGTIDENPGSGGGADLEDNKTATIDVSTYTEPVEITPTAGKDGMKKATITLDNIPSGTTAYAWVNMSTITPLPNYFNFDIAPSNITNEKKLVVEIDGDGNFLGLTVEQVNFSNYVKISDTSFEVMQQTRTVTYTRNAENDVTLW